MLSVLCLRILTSLIILRYDLGDKPLISEVVLSQCRGHLAGWALVTSTNLGSSLRIHS
jgi:hypothetical protein